RARRAVGEAGGAVAGEAGAELGRPDRGKRAGGGEEILAAGENCHNNLRPARIVGFGGRSGRGVRSDSMKDMALIQREFPTLGLKHALEKDRNKPVSLPLDEERIPLEIRQRAQWVCWRYEWIEDRG